MLKWSTVILCLAIMLLPAHLWAETTSHARARQALMPPQGKLLHGTYTGGRTGEEDDIMPADLRAYIRTVGAKPAWVYFSNNWYRSRAFPTTTAKWIRAAGSTPYVRLMMRSDPEQDHREPLFTVKAIARGDFDMDLAKWARAAALFETPILAEYGTEMNGEWFQWNGRWNGRRKGVERFAAAYRRIIDISRANGATNIVWVFHVNHADRPPKPWNRMENYYPGDGYIDWLGISLYSIQAPFEDERTPFSDINQTIQRLHHLAPTKPVIIAEFGTDVHNPREPAAPWASAALNNILGNRWPQLIGFSWWNETWPNGNDPANDTDTHIQSDPDLTAIFRRALKHPRIAR